MGRLILTVVGMVGGFLIGGPMGASIGATLGGMLGSALFGPTIEGPRLTDLKVSASTYGQAIPEIYGTVRLGTNMVWSTGIKETKHKSGGKGQPKQVTYSYSATFAMAICKGPIDSLLRVWADGKLIYDASVPKKSFIDQMHEAGIFAFMQLMAQKKDPDLSFRTYYGDEAQMPDSLIEADKGVGNVSAMRGLAYLVFNDMQLEDFANRIPGISVEVSKTSRRAFPATPLSDPARPESPTESIDRWAPDWEANRLVGTGRGITKVADLTTMKVLTRKEQQYGAILPYGGVIVSTRNNTNSRRFYVTDSASLTDIAQIGNDGGHLDMIYKDSEGHLIEQYSANHYFWAFQSNDYGYGPQAYLIAVSGFGGLGVFGLGGGPPVFLAGVPWMPQGIVAAGSNRFLFWRMKPGLVGGLEIHIYGVTGTPTFSDVPGAYVETPYTSDNVGLDSPFAGTTRYEPRVVLYDPTDDCLFSMGYVTTIGIGTVTVGLFKYSLATRSFKFRRVDGSIRLPDTLMEYSRLEGGSFGYVTGRFLGDLLATQINLQTGEVMLNQVINAAPWGPGLTNEHWDDRTSSLMLTTFANTYRIYFRDDSNDITLGSVVADLCTKTGVLNGGDIDASALDDITMPGYLIDRQSTARDCLKQLGTAFFFDGFESDFQLKFKKRGGTSLVTIPEDWITRDKDGIVVKETMTQELEMPMRITVNYNDIERDYQQGSQTAKRNSAPLPTMLTAASTAIDMPLAWHATDAKRCAEKLLKMAWANRFAYDFTLPWRYLKYDPTDVGHVLMDDGTNFFLRFDSLSIGADFAIQAKAVSEKASAYTSVAVGSPGLGIPFQTITIGEPAVPIVLNVPLLRDIDYDANGNSWLYFSAAGKNTLFTGATVFGTSSGVEYTPLGAIPATAINGRCMTKLPATKSYESIDENIELRIVLNNADTALLESTTLEEMLNDEANFAAIGAEVIQYRDAVQQPDQTWLLTGILRARRGTNYAVASHTVAERFVALEAGGVMRTQRPPSQFNISMTFKASGGGERLEDADPFTYDLIPRDLMPYSPEHVTLTEDGTDCVLKMERRSRITNTMIDGNAPIAYREGSMTSAKIAYQVWAGKTLSQYPTTDAPDFHGEFPLFDVNGVEAPIVIPFARGTETRFLVKVYEVGFVDGTPKVLQFTRGATGDPWDATELY